MKYVHPVLTGIIVTVTAGLMLLAAGYILPAILFNLFDGLPWRSALIIIGATLILWIVFSAAVGGYWAVQFIAKKEDFVIFLLIVVSGIIAWCIAADLPFLIKMISLGAGYITGGWLGTRHKNKKAKGILKIIQDQ